MLCQLCLSPESMKKKINYTFNDLINIPKFLFHFARTGDCLNTSNWSERAGIGTLKKAPIIVSHLRQYVHEKITIPTNDENY